LEEREEQQPAEAEVTETPEQTEVAETVEAPEAPETVEAPAAPETVEAPQADATPPQEESAPDASAEADEPAPPVEQEPVRTLADLAADARYSATGKRKSSVARVIVRPGSGQFVLNDGRTLEQYFPRRTHQVVVRQPLDAAGYADRIDVRARIHGGGISGQADALRHGIAKALIEADPALRSELKRRQLLTRDPRVKERKKAGLKKARKRPQFSKR
jgi:small subunit ribosomal protein S9